MTVIFGHIPSDATEINNDDNEMLLLLLKCDLIALSCILLTAYIGIDHIITG